MSKYSAVYVLFKNNNSSELNLVWTKEQRPSIDHFLSEAQHRVTENTEFLLLPRVNGGDRQRNAEVMGDYFLGILPLKQGTYEYSFEMYRLDCRRWINDRWVGGFWGKFQLLDISFSFFISPF